VGSGRPFSSFGPGLDAYPATPFRLVGLRVGRAELDERIAERFEAQMDAGFLDEVRALRVRPGGISRTAAQALGYRELLAHLDGQMSRREAVDQAITRTRQYARRQERWFRRDPRIGWVDGGDRQNVVRLVGERLRD
jgi:tRNA dimethylallyltransferase